MKKRKNNSRMKTLGDIPHLEGVKALVRVDFNVPVDKGAVVDDYRIRMALPTIQFLREKGAAVILISHIESVPSLEPVAAHLEKLGMPVVFIKDYKKAYEMIEAGSREQGAGSPEQKADDSAACFLLENLRAYDGEKKNDPKFAEQLASLADIYVNDAFSVSHREHASVVGVPRLLPSYAGLQLEKEIKNLSRAFEPEHPFLFILGGAKFDTKLPLVRKFAASADAVFIGGALANDLLKARGSSVGSSLVSSPPADLSAVASDARITTFADAVTADRKTKNISEIAPNDVIADAGPHTLEMLARTIAAAKFILWNGPFGIYEKGFTEGTIECAKLVAANSKAVKIVGGGDTLAAIASLGIDDKFTFISTGGGAMLDFLAQGTLPGIQALEHSQTE